MVITLVSIIFLAGCSNSASQTELAKCLTEKGTKMYGAYWCPHCANQKSMFGNSFQYVTYVECSLPERAGVTEICKEQKIQRYPTWEFPDGSRLETVQALETLAEKSGCEFP